MSNITSTGDQREIGSNILGLFFSSSEIYFLAVRILFNLLTSRMEKRFHFNIKSTEYRKNLRELIESRRREEMKNVEKYLFSTY